MLPLARPAIVLALVFALLGCIPPGSPARTAAMPTQQAVDPIAPTATLTPTAPALVPTRAASAPAGDAPWDVPVYPGAAVDAAEEARLAGQNLLSDFGSFPVHGLVAHAYRSAAGLVPVTRFYQEELSKGGWQQDLFMTAPDVWTGMWHRGNTLLLGTAAVDGDQILITLARGESKSLPPAFQICTAQEAYAIALKEMAAWQADAYLVELRGGKSRATPISPGGCSQDWGFTFFSPGTGKERGMGIGFYATATGNPVMGEPAAAPARPRLEGWLDSPQVYAAAEALGGRAVREKYPDAGLEYLMKVDEASGRTWCVLSYTSYAAPQGSPLNTVYRLVLDGTTGELIQVQVKDGEWQR